MKEVENRVQEVVLFNTILGRYDSPTSDDLLAQARVVREEALELFEAVSEGHSQEDLLKECVDVLVVAHGFAALLNAQGYDVSGAWKEVNKNNMSKFCSTQSDAFYTKMGYEATEGDGFIVEQAAYDKWAVKDRHGKLRKPIGYEKVDLKAFTAEAKESGNEGVF